MKEIRIRLKLNMNKAKPVPKTRPQLVNRVRYLATGRKTSSNETQEGAFVEEMQTVSLKESAEQAKLTALGHNCKIRTSQWKTLIVVEIWPGIKTDANEELNGAQQFGQRYQITSDSTVFPKAQLDKFKVPDSDEGGWQLSIVKKLPGFDTAAPLVGLILNRITDRQAFSSKIGKEETGLDMEPLIADILGERSRQALKTFADELDEAGREAAGFLVKKTTPSKLPMVKP